MTKVLLLIGLCAAAMAQTQGPPQSLQLKMQRFQEEMMQLQREGRDLAPVGGVMQAFEPLMKAGRFQEAEAVLDRALALLDGLENGANPDPGFKKLHERLLLEDSRTASIYVVDAEGAGKKLVARGGTPSWTPDGGIIFVSDRGGSRQIWISDARGARARQIGDLPAGMLPVMPQLGKNGLIVFMGADENMEPDSNVGIWLMRKDGSGLRRLVRGMQPFLAPSGAWIAYTLQTDEPYHREIWRVNTNGTEKRQLTFLGDPDYPDANAPSISPDETQVAFFSGKESDRGAQAFKQTVFTFGHRNVAVIPAGGGARRTLTPCRPVTTPAELDATRRCIAADNPSWTPDGKRLIVDVGFKSGTETWMVDLDGRNFQRFYSRGRGTVRVPLGYSRLPSGD